MSSAVKVLLVTSVILSLGINFQIIAAAANSNFDGLTANLAVCHLDLAHIVDFINFKIVGCHAIGARKAHCSGKAHGIPLPF